MYRNKVRNVIDTTAPEFDEEVEDETYVCGDEIPGAPEVSATDACSENINITFTADTPAVAFTNGQKVQCGPYSPNSHRHFLWLYLSRRRGVQSGRAAYIEPLPVPSRDPACQEIVVDFS